MMARVNITDRAKRYRAQNAVTGPRKCVLCGSTKDLGVMHLTGNEDHGERANLAYGCRSCNGKLAAAFKRIGAGRPTNQYNPAKGGVPTFEQYMWAVSNHTRTAHDEGGAVIHATPKHKRIEYARRIVSKAQATKRERADERWNPASALDDIDIMRDGHQAKQALMKSSGISEKVANSIQARSLKDQYRIAVEFRDIPAGKQAVWIRGWKRYGRANPWPWSRPDARRTTPASGGIAYHMGKAGKRPAAAPAKRKTAAKESGGYSIPDEKTLQEGFKRGLSLSDMLKANPALRKSQKSNPGLFAKLAKRVKSNPAAVAAEVFEDFHGFEPTEVVTVQKQVHHHAHLASLGILVQLDVWGVDGKGHKVTGFKGALLACNEGRDQLFIEGGDQTMKLADFGIRKPHETETLGRVTNIGYQTNKTHLGDEGGEAVYVHRFRATNRNGKHVVVKMTREPDLIYDVRNEQLLFSGGSYEILREGINK
jgi:hypothetical protein